MHCPTSVRCVLSCKCAAEVPVHCTCDDDVKYSVVACMLCAVCLLLNALLRYLYVVCGYYTVEQSDEKYIRYAVASM